MRHWFKHIRGVSSTLLVLAVLGGGWAAWHHFAQRHLNPHAELDAEQPATSRDHVDLTDAQIEAGKVATAVVQKRVARLSVTVPGRLAYDETRRVSVRLGTAGMLTKVCVQPGDAIEAGQVLATMSSPEIGAARADELQRAAEFDLAKRQADWDAARASGVRQLITAIQSGQSPEQIRDAFTDQQLGAAREKLLSAYTDQLLAQSLASRLETAADSGALPARTIEERRRKFESSGAALQAMIEQTLFDSQRSAQMSEIALSDARRRWEIAADRVATLLGVSNTLADAPAKKPNSESSASQQQSAQVQAASPQAERERPEPNAPEQQRSPAQDLSTIEIRAPRSGSVEQKLFNANERVEAGAELFVLADTSQLWVRADLRESQWAALATKAGQVIRLQSPALPDQWLQATVVRMGREVDPQTNAISLVASIDNSSGQLRPGLYVRVELPLGETASELSIPDAAVATHAGESFVFVTTDGHHFVRRDVRLGRSHEGFVEVIAGLEPGERIAVGGVFMLKSELLLEVEE